MENLCRWRIELYLHLLLNPSNTSSIYGGIESYDNAHNSFFIHLADHPGLSIVTHILDGTDYNNWSIAMCTSFDANNKLAFVDGTLPRPDIHDALFKIWSRCNSMVKSWGDECGE